MPLVLHVDSDRWREHLRSTWNPDIVPVAKGNGYGFGNQRLMAEARALGARTVAVGTYFETQAVRRTADRSTAGSPCGARAGAR